MQKYKALLVTSIGILLLSYCLYYQGLLVGVHQNILQKWQLTKNHVVCRRAGAQTAKRLCHCRLPVCAPYLGIGMTPFVNPKRVFS